MIKPLPVHVQDWQGDGLAAGAITQMRVPELIQLPPRGNFKAMVLRNSFGKGDAGSLFWVAEACKTYRGRRTHESMRFVDYAHSLADLKPRPYCSTGWKQDQEFTAQTVPPSLSRTTLEVLDATCKPLVEISDDDVAAEGMGFLLAPSPRRAFLRSYLEFYGEEFGKWTSDCMVVRFKVITKYFGDILKERSQA